MLVRTGVLWRLSLKRSGYGCYECFLPLAPVAGRIYSNRLQSVARLERLLGVLRDKLTFLGFFTPGWCLVCSVDAAEEPKPIFWGSKPAWTKIKNESPLHIAAAHMAAAGASYRKIYQELGRSESWITNLARQPFFQARVDSIVKEKLHDAWTAKLEMSQLRSVEKKINYLRAANKRPRDSLGRFCG